MSAQSPSLAGRAIQGSTYSIGASLVTLALGFVRSVLLARLLIPEHFGVMALAMLFINLVDRVRALGLSGAIIHRDEIDDRMTATYFTMQLLLLVLSLIMLLGLVPVLSRSYPQIPLLSNILIVMVAVNFLKGINAYPETFLSRTLTFRRLAIADIAASVTMTVLAPLVAWQDGGVWSLVVEQASGQLVRALVCWFSPVIPTPRLGWNRNAARWLWNFGIKAWLSSNLTFLIDRFDDFWIGSFLGDAALGFYSRAYEFARYPRRIVANPLTSVFFPTFARLQNQRLRLSQTFYRVTSLMVRLDLWVGMTLALVAPLFIALVLGEHWLPMRTTFQLMILYTFADPLTVINSNLLRATGHPGWVAQTRLAQLIVFIPAVIGLGHWLGIEGVAIAADLMAITGVVLLFVQGRRLVDYSLRAMWLWPVVAVTLAGGVVLFGASLWRMPSLWMDLVTQVGLSGVLYGGILWVVEREQVQSGWALVRRMLRPMLERI